MKALHRITIDCGYATHPGMKRQLNEDSYCIEPDLGLWAVTDGMGGHASGEIASAIVARELPRLLRQGQDLPAALRSVDKLIHQAAQQGKGGAGMGATVVAVQLTGMRYQIAWVGDSRAYQWKSGLRQLTRDHSYVQLLLEAGLIDESEMASHPERNVISQALGGNHLGVEVETVSGQLSSEESLLLCSDGLTNELSDVRIAAILAAVEDNQTRVDRLLAAALGAGGSDNITVVLLTATDFSIAPPSKS